MFSPQKCNLKRKFNCRETSHEYILWSIHTCVMHLSLKYCKQSQSLLKHIFKHIIVKPVLLYMYRHNCSKDLSNVFENCFVANNKIHKPNIWNSKELHEAFQRTNYRKHTVFNKGIDIWNELQLYIKGTTCRIC